MEFFKEDKLSAFDAKAEAQRIAFAPVMFQACRVLRDAGVLELVQQSGATGLTLNEIAAQIKMPRYGLKVLLGAGLGQRSGQVIGQALPQCDVFAGKAACAPVVELEQPQAFPAHAQGDQRH